MSPLRAGTVGGSLPLLLFLMDASCEQTVDRRVDLPAGKLTKRVAGR